MMFSFAGTAQEAGAGGRSGAAGIPVHGSLMGCFNIMNIGSNNTFTIQCFARHQFSGECSAFDVCGVNLQHCKHTCP